LKRLPTDYRDQVPARQGCHGPAPPAPSFPRGYFFVAL
jgi:hypothetical protein